MKNDSRFLDDTEKLEYFSTYAEDIDLEEYPHYSTMKVYVGAEYLIYTYREDGSLLILTSPMVTGISIRDAAVRIHLIDKRHYTMYSLSDIPSLMGEYAVIGHVPYRCTIERTVRARPDNKLEEGMCTGMMVRTKHHRSSKVPGGVYIVPERLAYKILDNDLLSKAMEELNGR